MPLYKTIKVSSKTNIYVWKIEESYDELLRQIRLNELSLKRLNGMKSELHQRGFLSIRHLLKIAGYSDFDLYYNSYGKPLLKDDTCISISHSYQYSAIILSDQDVGIDIEKNRKMIEKIQYKFVNTERDSLSDEDLSRQLTIIWGAKEAMYKIYPYGGLSFKNNIAISPFLFADKKSKGNVTFGNWNKNYNIYFSFLEDGFSLVYALPLL